MLTLLPDQLHTVVEAPDLFVDAYAAADKRMIFASFWGRDTAVQQLLGNLTLSPSEGGLHSLTLQGRQGIHMRLTDRELYDKRATRNYHRTAFGQLVNLWVFDKRCAEPDRVNRQSLALFPDALITADINRLLWGRIRELAPWPLLDHWQDNVLHLLKLDGAIVPLKDTLGVTAFSLDVSSETLEVRLSHCIRTGVLGVH
ncbi:hypothetical protein [Carnimonas bestiolae]|uniref:hypothetical protein n=1 Tax=Carnimonas bestiolae TaxID=3402172 RepID=UPI003EDBECCD